MNPQRWPKVDRVSMVTAIEVRALLLDFVLPERPAPKGPSL